MNDLTYELCGLAVKGLRSKRRCFGYIFHVVAYTSQMQRCG
jgi:hypothetical protein